MANLTDILPKEEHNLGTIYLYREGVFYQAYERSAFLFVQYVKPFLTKKRRIKSLNREVVSVGFPTRSLYSYFPKEQVYEVDNRAEITLDAPLDLAAFEQWRAAIPLTEPSKRPEKETRLSGGTEDDLVRQIKAFPIEAKTPLDCMHFLSELKNRLV